MGWSDGQGLGASGSGPAAPLGVELKTKRTGLGIDEDRKRHQAEAELLQQERGDNAMQNSRFLWMQPPSRRQCRYYAATMRSH